MAKKAKRSKKKSAKKKPAIVPTRLNRLNNFVLTRVILFLTADERKHLQQVDPRCAVEVGTNQQTTNGKNHGSEDGNGKKLFMTTISDPDTLLARLNTRRLFQRIRFLRRELLVQPEDGTSLEEGATIPYPSNRTTQAIAVQEWKNLLENARKTSETRVPVVDLPSPYELLLFSPCPRPVTVLASYPRSGNSLLRNLFERVTLRVTGSDMRGGLTQHDLVGEAAVSTQKVQFVKTHFPERMGRPAFLAARAVLLVRNPYDALESYFNLMTTNTHTTSLTDSLREQHEQVFREMVLKEILVWKMFHKFWLQQKIPILLIRYEDLIRHPDKVLARVIRFVLEINDMAFFQGRIDRCLKEERIENVGAYKPRSGGIGKSLVRFPPDLLQEVNHGSGIFELMHQLGYGELLVPNPEEWKLPPIPNYGFELPGRQQGAVETVKINGGPIVRGPKLRTDWKAVRKAVETEGSGDSNEKSAADDIQNPYEVDELF